MDRTLFALSLGLAGFILAPNLSHASPAYCGPYYTVAAALAKQARSFGVAQDNTVTELYARGKSGTVTNLVSCLVASGAKFETVTLTRVGKG